ncbi:hypothetical protein [Pseudomonas citronellolis]|jgi:hypothetical protein|uniref:hypothetical protein n=1 Tax=Pseudomonas citronellolis TaxID=53408 RepID=UPI000A6A2213
MSEKVCGGCQWRRLNLQLVRSELSCLFEPIPYLHASSNEQDANHARGSLEAFVADHGHVIASMYMERASGAFRGADDGETNLYVKHTDNHSSIDWAIPIARRKWR